MNIVVPVTDAGAVAPGWGRAQRVAIANVIEGDVRDWTVHDVHWDTLHDEGTDGAHHARVARFLLDNDVKVVVVEHMGDGMARMLATMGIRVVTGAEGDARTAVLNLGSDD